jgi:hypothetical protein
MSELQKYEKMLKDNKATIKSLVDQNKHIESHIKFLRSLDQDFDEDPAEKLDSHDSDFSL